MRSLYWEFHDYNIPYVTGAIRIAPSYNVTHVVFSHRLLYYAEELLVDKYRARHIEQLGVEARRHGIKPFLWTHEISQVPDEYLAGNKADLDRKGLWRFLSEKYEQVFERVPSAEGVVLTLRETPFNVLLDERVVCSMSPPERVTRLVNCLSEVCEKHNKTLIVRSFVYEPSELHRVREGLSDTPTSIAVQTKEVPHDWQPYYPHNPLINVFPERDHLLETHLAAETGGGDDLMYCHPEYTKYRMDHARRHGMTGLVARVDWGEAHALGSPNEINVYAASRFLEEPGLSADEVWHEWAEKHYGRQAAPFIVSALKRTFDICNKVFHVHGFWFTKSGLGGGYDYITRSLRIRSTAKWSPDDPELVAWEQRLQHPDRDVLLMLVREKDEAIAAAKQTIQEIDKAGLLIEARPYQELKRRAELLLRIARIWKGITEAYFGLRVHEETADTGALAVAQEGVRRMRRVMGEVDRFWDHPRRWQRVHTVADDFERRIEQASH